MSLSSLATTTISTQRPIVAAGARTFQAKLTGLQCTPFYPADGRRIGELMTQLKLDTLQKVWETFVLGAQDIEAGDRVLVGNRVYLVRAAGPWTPPVGDEPFTQVSMEEQIGA